MRRVALRSWICFHQNKNHSIMSRWLVYPVWTKLFWFRKNLLSIISPEKSQKNVWKCLSYLKFEFTFSAKFSFQNFRASAIPTSDRLFCPTRLHRFKSYSLQYLVDNPLEDGVIDMWCHHVVPSSHLYTKTCCRNLK